MCCGVISKQAQSVYRWIHLIIYTALNLVEIDDCKKELGEEEREEEWSKAVEEIVDKYYHELILEDGDAKNNTIWGDPCKKLSSSEEYL